MTSAEAWNWEEVTTLSVPGSRLVSKVEALLGGDAEARRAAGAVLYCELANQGQLYSAAAPCVDLIAEYACEHGRLNAEAVSLLEAVLSARTPGLVVTVHGGAVDVAEYCRGRILELVPVMLGCADGKDSAYLREVFFLVPQLADSSPQVLDFLRKQMSSLDGEMLMQCRGALEEAEEVVRDGHMP